jgi:glycosyltransferase involved in cell wall biosynthesis
MNFVIITHVPHIKQNGAYFAYAPYVKEMNIWLRHVDSVSIVAPLDNGNPTAIDLNYEHKNLKFTPIKKINAIGIANKIKAFFTIPRIAFEIFKAMKRADHIHLRCPGNIGLIGCVIQIFFPRKPKTAKYAGNWDFYAKQPFSYKFQKWILSNTTLTKNMQVLIYGNWEKQTKNIKPFFTASYSENDKKELSERYLNGPIKTLFVGTLSVGKNPMYALKMVHRLIELGYDMQFDIYGEGVMKNALEQYISDFNLNNSAKLHGNQNSKTLQEVYQKSHFLILPSRSEGWPKAVAEAMFWGCIPIATPVSCIASMLGNGERGILLDLNLNSDVKKISAHLESKELFQAKSKLAASWSQKYTLDYFDSEIRNFF